MIFEIDPELTRNIFERYERALIALPDQWGADSWETEPPPELQKYLSPKAHCLAHVKSLLRESFWASLEKVEGRHHLFEVVYCDYDLVDSPLIFSNSTPFEARQIAKLSAAIQRGAALGVWPDEKNRLSIWGFETRQTNSSGPCLRMAVIQPGTIITGTGGSSYFIALLSPRKAGFVDQDVFTLIKQRLEGSTEDPNSGSSGKQRYFPLMQAARAMRLHGHGGTLLVVPGDTGDWEESISWGDGTYKSSTAFKDASGGVDAIAAKTDLIGRLTAVDGATVINRDLAVLGFGAKINCTYDPNATVLENVPLEGSKPESKTISKLGGTRHQSTARFVGNNKDSIAVVASQDGVLSLVAWDEKAGNAGLICVTRHAEWQLW